MIRRKQIRTMVEKLLTERGIREAPIPVADIAKSLGAIVCSQSAEDELSGFLYRDKKSASAIIGVNERHHPNRRNFTAAHELGHYLLHDFGDVHVDRQSKIWLRDKASSQGVSLEEMEANLFAAELLMPEHLIKKDIEHQRELSHSDEDMIRELAQEYEVSEHAMTIRLAYLGYMHH